MERYLPLVLRLLCRMLHLMFLCSYGWHSQCRRGSFIRFVLGLEVMQLQIYYLPSSTNILTFILELVDTGLSSKKMSVLMFIMYLLLCLLKVYPRPVTVYCTVSFITHSTTLLLFSSIPQH